MISRGFDIFQMFFFEIAEVVISSGTPTGRLMWRFGFHNAAICSPEWLEDDTFFGDGSFSGAMSGSGRVVVLVA